jgi:hypothetical protein
MILISYYADTYFVLACSLFAVLCKLRRTDTTCPVSQVRFLCGPDPYLWTLVPEYQREVGADVREAGEEGQVVRLPLQHSLEVLL